MASAIKEPATVFLSEARIFQLPFERWAGTASLCVGVTGCPNAMEKKGSIVLSDVARLLHRIASGWLPLQSEAVVRDGWRAPAPGPSTVNGWVFGPMGQITDLNDGRGSKCAGRGNRTPPVDLTVSKGWRGDIGNNYVRGEWRIFRRRCRVSKLLIRGALGSGPLAAVQGVTARSIPSHR
jgi:hypothetical protein